MHKFSIITPCFNAERHIQETVDSVIAQSALTERRASLEYIVCDGGSTDRTLTLLQSMKTDALSVVSEPDRGMYDALSKGLKRASGDIVAYLNAGDIYNLHAFDTVLDIFESRPVHWLTGSMVIYNERSQITYMKLPFRYRRCFFENGMYGRYLNTVQQESTFWSSSLHRLIDFDVLSN